ncbi:MAG TPA: hypothetical protein VHC22_23310 [Pirellulales bacterium]|nr:hypothetical protein [Pirellulales bacterium]
MTLPPKDRWTLVCAAGWALVVALGGGLACGWCITTRFGELGAVSLIACGMLAGSVSRKITGRASVAAGTLQAIGVCLAFIVAETCWLHWKTENGAASWSDAIRFWPAFLREYTLSVLIGASCAGYGAWSAYGLATDAGQRAKEPAEPVTPSP